MVSMEPASKGPPQIKLARIYSISIILKMATARECLNSTRIIQIEIGAGQKSQTRDRDIFNRVTSPLLIFNA
jgi:hypothetical protein